MPAVKERTNKQTRWLIPVIAGAVIVISLVVGIIVHHKKPLTFEDGFVASPTETAVLRDKDGGGTAFIGISKPVIKAHGSSNAEAIENAVLQAKQFALSGIIDDIEKNIDLMKVEKE